MKYLDSWEEPLRPITHILKDVLIELRKRKENEYIVPLSEDSMNAFFYCPFDELKVVIPGKAPYINLYLDEETKLSKPVANGFSYATSSSSFVPSRLRRIISCLNINIYPQQFHQELLERTEESSWGKRQALQGVFLYNMALTANTIDAFAHSNIWHPFSTALMELLADTKPLVWLFFDESVYQLLEGIIGNSNYDHCIVKAFDPMSQDFFQKEPFLQVNECLDLLNYKPINW